MARSKWRKIAADQVQAEDVDMENGYAEDLKKLTDYGISKAVSLELVKIYGTGYYFLNIF